MENILISGGAGFIGSNLALKLVKLELQGNYIR